MHVLTSVGGDIKEAAEITMSAVTLHGMLYTCLIQLIVSNHCNVTHERHFIN